MVQPGSTRPNTRSQYKSNEEDTHEEEDTYSDTQEEVTNTQEQPVMAAPGANPVTMDQESFIQAFERMMTRNAEQFREMMDKRQPDANSTTLKPSEVYLFKPTSQRDDRSARIFIERITDATHIYQSQPQKLALLLPRCLDNEIAHVWYSALTDYEKSTLTDSLNAWITILKRDFMGTTAELRSSADKECFRWSQGRTPAEYVNEKVSKLRMAGMTSEPELVQHVYEGFSGTPELQISLASSRGTLQQFREHLREVQDNHRRLYEQKGLTRKESRYPQPYYA